VSRVRVGISKVDTASITSKEEKILLNWLSLHNSDGKALFFTVQQEAFNTAFKSFQTLRLRQISPTIEKNFL